VPKPYRRYPPEVDRRAVLVLVVLVIVVVIVFAVKRL
jgi:hypothetical protein